MFLELMVKKQRVIVDQYISLFSKQYTYHIRQNSYTFWWGFSDFPSAVLTPFHQYKILKEF